MKYNPDKINKLSFELKKAVANLYRLSTLDRDVFLSDPDKTSSAKYSFIIAIEAIIDISNHVIAKNMLRAPEDYADTFRVMMEAGIFTEKFTGNLIKMAKFRNRLVHIYWEVDEELFYTFLRQNLSDIEDAIDIISTYINGN